MTAHPTQPNSQTKNPPRNGGSSFEKILGGGPIFRFSTMMAQRDDAAEIKTRLNDDLERLLKNFWPGYVTRGKMAYCAPSGRADDLGSFVVYLGKWESTIEVHGFAAQRALAATS